MRRSRASPGARWGRCGRGFIMQNARFAVPWKKQSMNTDPVENYSDVTGLIAGEPAHAAIRSQHRRLKWLTWTAALLWAVTVVGTVVLLVTHSLFVSPKLQQMLADYGAYGTLPD